MKLAIQQLDFMAKYVKAMAKDVEDHFRMEFEVTSLFRMDDPGCHGTLPCRAMDLGCKDHVIGERVADYLNKRWIYDPTRPSKVCAIYHTKKGGQPHIHVQSHPSTKRRYHD